MPCPLTLSAEDAPLANLEHGDYLTFAMPKDCWLVRCTKVPQRALAKVGQTINPADAIDRYFDHPIDHVISGRLICLQSFRFQERDG